MDKICLMKNIIQKYDWGSKIAIPELFGRKTPSESPLAEMWMGAHPKATSQVKYDGCWMSLIELIKKNSKDILGEKVSREYNSRLPFLFKVLAAAKPLSIQAHPNLIQAKKGFEKENQLGIPIDAFNRNYKDDNHKPECICALTSFCALNGFRKIPIILELMGRISNNILKEKLNNLKNQQDASGLKIFFSFLLTLTRDDQQEIISSAIKTAQKYADSRDNVNAYEWVVKLHKNYPWDIGILSPLILNLVRLEPGQAMFLPARQLHTYLEGTGVELMANSDNVLRGGLTPKYVDVPELLSVLNFESKKIDMLLPREINDFEKKYQTPAKEFVLSIISIKGKDIYISSDKRNVEILLCIEGNASIADPSGRGSIPFSSGHSVLIPGAVTKYTINGNAVIYKASVPNGDGSKNK